MALLANELQLAELYYLTGSVQFGSYRLSAHRDNPGLELSPLYLKYPPRHAHNEALLQELYGLAGKLILERILASQELKYIFTLCAAIPDGANPIAEAVVREFGLPESHLVHFRKENLSDGGTEFVPLTPLAPLAGLQLLIIDDHTSGGRNKLLLLKVVREAGLRVSHMFTVIDRQQGGEARLEQEGVTLHSLLTLDQLLDCGAEKGYLTHDKAQEVRSYIQRNQLTI